MIPMVPTVRQLIVINCTFVHEGLLASVRKSVVETDLGSGMILTLCAGVVYGPVESGM